MDRPAFNIIINRDGKSSRAWEKLFPGLYQRREMLAIARPLCYYIK